MILYYLVIIQLMKQKIQFTETIATDDNGLVEWYESLTQGKENCVPIKNTPKYKAEVLISYNRSKKTQDVEIKYDFYNIKPL